MFSERHVTVRGALLQSRGNQSSVGAARLDRPARNLKDMSQTSPDAYRT